MDGPLPKRRDEKGNPQFGKYFPGPGEDEKHGYINLYPVREGEDWGQPKHPTEKPKDNES